jgi:hypothetical protein
VTLGMGSIVAGALMGFVVAWLGLAVVLSVILRRTLSGADTNPCLVVRLQAQEENADV